MQTLPEQPKRGRGRPPKAAPVQAEKPEPAAKWPQEAVIIRQAANQGWVYATLGNTQIGVKLRKKMRSVQGKHILVRPLTDSHYYEQVNEQDA